MRDDLKAALRSLRSSKGFTVAALIVLTLGIGATTAIFSVVDAVVLRGLPFDEHDRLVAVGERMRRLRPIRSVRTRSRGARSRRAAELPRLGGRSSRCSSRWPRSRSGWLTLREPGAEPESLVPQRVTAELLHVLRVQPAIGRTFTAENEVAGRDRVAVLSDGLWRRRFGADPQIVGRAIPLEDLEGGPRQRRKASATKSSASCRRTSPIRSARHAPTDIWVPYVVPADQRMRDPQQRRQLPAGHRAAEARRVARAGAGADGSDRRRARAGESGLEQGQHGLACGRSSITSSARASSRGC